MTNILTFRNNTDYEIINSDGSILLKIEKDNLRIETKSIYEQLFKDLRNYPNFELKMSEEIHETDEDYKKVLIVFTAINDLITSICEQVQERKIFEAAIN